ncbi:hypothetical protein [Burkholderia multivorans]|nr:hypothetical protein [Burkholderia multivorans]MDN8102668.1 hypothetical protein [Burkholderia multivorans]
MQIPAIYPENHGKPFAADVNPQHVVAAYPSKLHPGCTQIVLNARDKEGAIRSFITPLSFETVLAAFGPFVSVEQKRIHDGTPVDYHVRPEAIVGVRHLSAGGGRVWLANGQDLLVTEKAMQSLATLVAGTVGETTNSLG